MRAPGWLPGSPTTILLFIFFASTALAQTLGEIRGRVVDGHSNEGLARVRVRLAQFDAVTDRHGRFRFQHVPAGEYELQALTVGYWMVRKPLQLRPGETLEVEIVLNPSVNRSDSVRVTPGPFDTAPVESPSEVTLEGAETKNLASVLTDDPLRAVQGLPGVTSNDDFRSQFSLRGAGFNRVGLYLDDVLLRAPFHMVQGEPDSATITILNGDTLDRVALHAGAPPSRFADRTAGILDLRTRDGSRQNFTLRATASATNSGVLAEGPLGSKQRGSWLASARQSYLQYILRATSDDENLAFAFSDVQGRLTYDLTPGLNLSLGVVDGRSELDKRDPAAGLNTIVRSHFHFTLANLTVRYAPSHRFLLTQRAAYLRQRADNLNRLRAPLAGDFYGEWVWNSQGTWNWRGTATLDFGGSVRRLRDDGFSISVPFNSLRAEFFRGTGVRAGAYAQQSWSLAQKKVTFSTGFRWDHHRINGIQTLSPYVSMAFQLSRASRVHLAWGQYVQFPEIFQFFSTFGSTRLVPERATHVEASLEHRFDERTRLRLNFYNRQDRDLIFVPLLEPRLISGQVFDPPANAPYRNSQRGYARGFQVLLQKRTANGLAGWISYAYGRTGVRDGALGIAFPADFDQRHSVNVFASWRPRSTVNLSAKWVYGSGMPLPGFFAKHGSGHQTVFFLADRRNQVRLPYYQRLDLRINKSWVHRRWQMTLFGEVINLLNRENPRFDEFRRFDPATGLVRLSFEKQFPILPSVGLVVEF